jgi:hypothetical protein
MLPTRTSSHLHPRKVYGRGGPNPLLPPELRPKAMPTSRRKEPPPAHLTKHFKVSASAKKRMGSESVDEKGRICVLDVNDALTRVPVLFAETGLHQHWDHTPKALFERLTQGLRRHSVTWIYAHYFCADETLRISRVSTQGHGQYINVTRGDYYNDAERSRLSGVDMDEVVHRFFIGFEMPKTQQYRTQPLSLGELS